MDLPGNWTSRDQRRQRVAIFDILPDHRHQQIEKLDRYAEQQSRLAEVGQKQPSGRAAEPGADLKGESY
jgi:hypothetical protein